MKKLYIYGPKTKGDATYTLVADDGEALASHFCSHPAFAQGDLHDNRPERIAEYAERFGKYQILWVGDDDMTKKRIRELNKAWHKALNR
jgi:hypothetical protein